jgi:hypothetical protein
VHEDERFAPAFLADGEHGGGGYRRASSRAPALACDT